MPCESDHIALANKNHIAMLCLHEAVDDHPEWVVTIAFYKAVHIVQAVFSKSNKSCHDHKTRHSILKRSYPDIWKQYRPLWIGSTIARYLHDNTSGTPYTSFVDYCSADEVYTKFVVKRLRNVEDLSVNRLSKDQKDILMRVPVPPREYS